MLNIRINRTARAATALAFGAALALAGVAQASAATTASSDAHADYRAAGCAAQVAGHMHCNAYVRTDVKRHLQAHGVHAAASSVSGLGP